MDIGGGSTEFIIGAGYKPQKLESLFMGCVSYSLRFFPDGKVSKSAMKQAELAARNELQPHRRALLARATGSRRSARPAPCARSPRSCSRTASATAASRRTALERLRSYLIKAGDMDKARARGTEAATACRCSPAGSRS